MNLEYIRLAETIDTYSRGRKVYLLCNPGNWGDGLIRYGTELFLAAFNIRYEKLSLDPTFSDRLSLMKSGLGGNILLCSGGGAWCGHYKFFARTVKQIQHRYRFRKIIVLPSTYEMPFDIPEVIFFRRDEYESRLAMPDSTFCHDMAFFLGPLESSQPTRKLLNCFRTDVESAGLQALAADNVDLSLKGTTDSTVFEFLEAIASYSTIKTDRLHVSIAGSLLNREVFLYPGSYFKNLAIYKTSIENRFPNTHWVATNKDVVNACN